MLGSEVAYVLDVEDRRQVFVVQPYLLAEPSCLSLGRTLGREEVVGSTQDAMLVCLVKIAVEVIIEDVRTFGCLDKDEAYRYTSELCVLQFVPVDFLLIVTHVDSAHVTFRIFYLAITRQYVKGRVNDYLSYEEQQDDGNHGNECPEDIGT